MFISRESLILNSVYIGDYITKVKYGYYKTWGKDAGRDTLSGTFTGTLLGIFPKITLYFRKLTQAELEILAPIFDSSSQTISYYDLTKKAQYSFTSYSGDWEIESLSDDLCEPFTISLIDRTKRS